MTSLKNSFEKLSKNNTLLSILMVVLGLILFIWPGKTLTLAARILGIALLLGAAVSGISWFSDRDKPGSTYATLAVAIVCLVAGIVVLTAPKGIITLLPKLVGLAILVNGVINLAQALVLRNVGNEKWISSVVMAVLTIALGGFLLLFAFSAMKAAVMVIGGILVYNGVSNLFIESRYRKLDR